ncbi:DNA-binding protein [Natrarchaeobius halalkaliphilus]|uniref:DNA-binding protein n=1 Tax=Natrarchaeobius halalkaliphilus TaxID=1679091 RepID=A0A3N6LI83_9EURY|nr:DNA-binding protein [Natrarchaeobius halalkaliphilus]RQG87024.1 DNA-binding protein [Natrarchaeobius halalkaliphilus]
MSQIATTPHEIEGRWKWPDWGRGPYDALSSVMLGPPFEGYLEMTVDVDGEPWLVKVSYSKSGFAPRLSDGINAERLYEWDIVGRGPGEKKASYNISPRFPNMRHWETGEPIQLPWENQVGDVDGVDVEFHTSNIEAERGLELLPEFFTSIFEEANERIYSEYFRTTPHSASRMWAYERYVRIRREWAETLSSAGVLQKIALYLSDLEGIKADLHINNKEVINHQNRLVLDPASAGELLPGHTYGRKFEIYQLKDPDAVSKDHPSYHPKVEVLVNKKINDGEAWAWADRDEVTEQIDEMLLNALHWEDIPLSPDGNGVYIPDDHFDAVAREKQVELYEDPTPRLEAKTDHLLMTTLRDMGETAGAVTEKTATDGGTTVDDLADELGKHPATIYRAIEELDEILTLDQGHVSFRVRKYHEELRKLVESAEYAIEGFADRIQHVMGLADHIAESSPFQQWLVENGAEIAYDENGEPKRVRIETILSELKASRFENVQTIAAEAIEKWRKSGNDPSLLRRSQLSWQTPDGGTEVGYVGTVADR